MKGVIDMLKKSIAKEKCRILRDMAILAKDDARLKPTYEMIRNCNTEYEAERILRDIFMERTTLNQVLEKKGLM